jgi:hypothetical protein
MQSAIVPRIPFVLFPLGFAFGWLSKRAQISDALSNAERTLASMKIDRHSSIVCVYRAALGSEVPFQLD